MCAHMYTCICKLLSSCSFTHMHMCWGPTSGDWTIFVGAYLRKKLILFILASMGCKSLWLHRHVKWCHYYAAVVLMLVLFRQSYCSIFMGIFFHVISQGHYLTAGVLDLKRLQYFISRCMSFPQPQKQGWIVGVSKRLGTHSHSFILCLVFRSRSLWSYC